MSRGVNKVILLGFLGKDPETRYTSGGTTVTNASLATSESWKDKNTGEKQERTEWHNLVLWGKLGEIAGEYLKKGSQVYVEGSLTTEKWQDKEGKDRYTTKIKVNDLQMLGNRGGGSAGAAPERQGEKQGARQAQQEPEFDDDIPF